LPCHPRGKLAVSGRYSGAADHLSRGEAYCALHITRLAPF